MTQGLDADPFFTPARRLRHEGEQTLDLVGARPVPLVVVRAPRGQPAPPERSEGSPAEEDPWFEPTLPGPRLPLSTDYALHRPSGPRPRASTPLACLELTSALHRAPAAPTPEAPDLPQPPPAQAPRPSRTLERRSVRYALGAAELVLGLGVTAAALVEFAEHSLLHARDGHGAVLSVVLEAFMGLALLLMNGLVNFVALHLTGRPTMLIGSLLAFPLAAALFLPSQAELTGLEDRVHGKSTVVAELDSRGSRPDGL